VNCGALEHLERELMRELTSGELGASFVAWSREEPTLARFRSPVDVVRFLHGRNSPDARDAVLRPLVTRAATDPAARRLVLRAVLPGLKNVARRLGVMAESRDEIWSTLFCCAWENLCAYSIDRRPNRIAANLVLDTMRSTITTLRVERAELVEVVDLDPWTARSSAASGDIDALFDRAVAAGAISAAEATLIASTRFDGIPLAHMANACGEPYNRVKVRRQRAERRLLVWLRTPSVPRGHQKRRSSSARVVGAGA
jgi:DNA-directed RNA polymerase specialized sigma24 family protein